MKKYSLKNIGIVSSGIIVAVILMYLAFPNFFALFSYPTMNCGIVSPTMLSCGSNQGGFPLASQTQVTDIGGALRQGSSVVNYQLNVIPEFNKLMSWEVAPTNECYMSSRYVYHYARETINFQNEAVNIFTHGGFCGGSQMPLVSTAIVGDVSSLFRGYTCTLEGNFFNPIANRVQPLFLTGRTDVEDGYIKCIFNFTNDQIARESPTVNSDVLIKIDLVQKYENSNKLCLINNVPCETPNILTPKECDSGQEKCLGTNFYDCEGFRFISRGITAGKCGVECVSNTDCQQQIASNNSCTDGVISKNVGSYNCLSNKCQLGKSSSVVKKCNLGCSKDECFEDTKNFKMIMYTLIGIAVIIILLVVFVLIRKRR